jgi:formylglycine-generating enzyme required for sulfatase activity
MSGNVFEWCFDAYGAYPSGTVTNPTGADNGSTRVIRGGDWYYNAGGTRSAFRYNFTPNYRRHNLGFRLALSPYQ